MQISVNVNGTTHTRDVEPRMVLALFLREVLGLTGTHIGCDTSSCGACTVLLNGKAIKSCTVLAVQADGTNIKTIEGMSANGTLHPLQEAFRDEHGLQCGFCTPGMIMTASALLDENPEPTEHEIREALEGNFCRCTGYHNIIRAVENASKRIKQEA